MTTYVHLGYVAQFFLKWEMFQKKIVEKNQNTHFMFNNLFPKFMPLWDNVEKYGRARRVTYTI